MQIYMKTLIQIFIAQLLGLSSISLASVNLIDGSYQVSNLDIEIMKGLYLERTYSSRSLHSGLFGFGWCSNLELRIEIKEDQIERFDCLQGISVIYKKQGSDGLYKSKQDEKSRFVVLGAATTQIYFDGEERHFDKSGKWTLWRLKEGTELKFKYDRMNRIHTLNIGKRPLIQFGYGLSKETRQVQSIESQGNRQRFIYQGLNLVRVSSGNRVLSQYEYDAHHNLTKMTDERKESRSITYNLNLDSVSSVLEDGCSKNYFYERLSFRRRAVQVTSQCLKNPSRNSSRYEFEFAPRSSGEQALKKLSQVSEGLKKETYFDPETSRPLNVYQEGKRMDYVYDPLGRLIAKNGHSSRIQLFYPPQDRKPSSVILHKTDPFGRSLSTESSELFYDSLGNLNLVRHSSGAAYEIRYEPKDRSLSLKPIGILNRQPTSGSSNDNEKQNLVALAFLKEFINDLPL